MKGGKLIGQGQYGCVFNPPLGCFKDKSKDTDRDRDRDKVGKVFFNDSEFNDEMKRMKQIELLDPKHTFTVPLLDHCKIIAQKHNSQCEINNNSCQIIYSFGGIDLNNIDNIDIKIIHCFLNIIKGIRVMHSNQYIHGDIKPGNILYHKKRNVLKLIDFGFASKSDDVYRNGSTIFDRMSAQYPYFPPEYFWFFYNIKIGKQPSIAHMKDQFNKTNNKEFGEYSINTDFSLSKFYFIMKSVKKFSQASWQVIACKADVYALGITLMEVVKKIDKNKRLLFMVRSVISHMIEPNVLDRWDINQVYVAWKEIVSFR